MCANINTFIYIINIFNDKQAISMAMYKGE